MLLPPVAMPRYRVISSLIHRSAHKVNSPNFVRESFGALLQMLSGLPESEREAVGEEIEEEIRRFEGPDGFEGPYEMIVGAGIK
jgi:hypothetical protein